MLYYHQKQDQRKEYRSHLLRENMMFHESASEKTWL